VNYADVPGLTSVPLLQTLVELAADVAALVASGRTTAVDVRHGRLAVLRRLP